MVGGLLGSATWGGRPKGRKGSRGNMVSLGENSPSLGVGGDSTNFIPAISEYESCRALLVIVSARGDIKASSSGRVLATVTSLSTEAALLSGSGEKLLGAGPTFKLENPKPEGPPPKRCEPNPGEGGGLMDKSDGTGIKLDAGFDANDFVGGLSPSPWSRRPGRPGPPWSSFSVHEKLDGAEDGPGDIDAKFDTDFPRERIGLLLSGLPPGETSSRRPGRGAVNGSLVLASRASADTVRRCFVGLLPLRDPEDRGNFLLATSFWKSCKQYIRRMLGLIHLLLDCAA